MEGFKEIQASIFLTTEIVLQNKNSHFLYLRLVVAWLIPRAFQITNQVLSQIYKKFYAKLGMQFTLLVNQKKRDPPIVSSLSVLSIAPRGTSQIFRISKVRSVENCERNRF